MQLIIVMECYCPNTIVKLNLNYFVSANEISSHISLVYQLLQFQNMKFYGH